MRWILMALMGVHGLIHLMGFAKGFGIGKRTIDGYALQPAAAGRLQGLVAQGGC